MRAVVLERIGCDPQLRERPIPAVGPGDVLVRVGACGVCRTDLHVADGDLPEPSLPVVLASIPVAPSTRIRSPVPPLATVRRAGRSHPGATSWPNVAVGSIRPTTGAQPTATTRTDLFPLVGYGHIPVTLGA